MYFILHICVYNIYVYIYNIYNNAYIAPLLANGGPFQLTPVSPSWCNLSSL